jgi:Lon protease-like protein
MSEMIPLFPLSTVLFPGMRLPLHIFEERYRLLAARLLELPEPRRFGVIAIRKGREVGADGVTALHDVGCVATIRQIVPHPDGRFDLAAVGTQRFRLLRLDDSLPYFQAEVEPLPDETFTGATGAPPADASPAGQAAPGAVFIGDTPITEGTDSARPVAVPGPLGVATRRVQAGFRAYLNALADRGGGVINVDTLPDEPVLLSYVVGAAMIIDLPERQSLLAAPTALERLRRERSLLVRETAMLRATTSRPAPDFTYETFSQN